MARKSSQLTSLKTLSFLEGMLAIFTVLRTIKKSLISCEEINKKRKKDEKLCKHNFKLFGKNQNKAGL